MKEECKTTDLEEIQLVSGLKVHHCPECGGNWMRFSDYFAWHVSHQDEPSLSEPGEFLPVEDSSTAKVCPDCGRLLTVHKVSSHLGFYLEHCGSCNGIWFDKNEWENIKQAGLHHQIHNFFTDSWQKKIGEEERMEFFDKLYTRKFGTEDYSKIIEIKKWLDGNENKSSLIAYLMNKDPYKL